MSTSSWLWWLNRNTAGRVARCSPPWTSSRTPASMLPSSPANVVPRSTASRREPVAAPSAAPVAKPPNMPGQPRRRAGEVPHPGPAAGAEPGHRPPVVPRRLLQLTARVDGPRPPDRLQERHVLVAVGVGVALRQVDVMLTGERADRRRLARPPQQRAAGTAGGDAVHDLHRRHQDVLHAHRPRRGLDLEPGGGGGQHDRVPGPAVGLDQPPPLRVQRAGDGLHEQPLPQFGELVLAAPGPHAHARAR